jgi:hypothetical protein
MQQFAAIARQQSRPPIAISGVSLQKRDHYSIPTSDHPSSLITNNIDVSSARSTQQISTGNIRHHNLEDVSRKEDENITRRDRTDFPMPVVDGDFTDSPSPLPLSGNHLSIHPYWNQDVRPALDRALRFAEQTVGGQIVLCRFVRIVSRAAIDSLSQIAYHISLLKHLQKEVEAASIAAERKKKKWMQSSAFLVALIRDQSPFVMENSDLTSFQALPYVPPASSLKLEEVS